jgi:two-component system response regulator TctD
MLRILLMDADPDSRGKIESGLVSKGFQVTCCPDEQQALGLCFSGAFDAVLIDLKALLAGEMRLTRRLREHVPFKSLPIIGMAKPGSPEVPLGSGLDQVIEVQDDVDNLACALHHLRQARGFLAAPEAAHLGPHQP